MLCLVISRLLLSFRWIFLILDTPAALLHVEQDGFFFLPILHLFDGDPPHVPFLDLVHPVVVSGHVLELASPGGFPAVTKEHNITPSHGGQRFAQAEERQVHAVDVLILDDIQELAGKEGTQKTFFHIFNHLHQSGKQLVLTCDKAPAELEGLEDRLLSRFRWGLAAEVKMPDFETRKEIVTTKARKEGIDFSDEVIDYICQNVDNNIRELEGVMISLLAQSTFNKCELTLDTVQGLLGKMVKKQSEELSLEKIQQVVCEHFNIPEELLQAKTRKREVVQARQLAMYFSKNLTKYSLSYIGNQIGKKDHATVLYACKAISDLMDTDRKFKLQVEEIQRKLYCGN